MRVRDAEAGVWVTAKQMNRLLKIFGCNCYVAVDGEEWLPVFDHFLDHLEQWVQRQTQPRGE